MRLSKSFSSFAALLALVSLLLTDVDARPALKQRGDGIITLPLTKRKTEAFTGIHPAIVHQQHVNLAHRRLARMTGAREPSDEELRENLMKRIIISIPGLSEDGGDCNLLEGCIPFSGFFPKSKSSSTASASIPKNSAVAFEASPASNVAQSSTLTSSAPAEASSGSYPSIPLETVEQDIIYMATVQIGTPARNFRVIMDTGSSDFWVGSESCQAETEDGGGCGNHTYLGSGSSSSFVKLNETFAITYGSGAVKGDKVKDTVTIAGMTLPQLQFGVANMESPSFTGDAPNDGLMGLAKAAYSSQGVPTPLEVLASNGFIKEQIVSFKISRSADNLNDGEITFGGLDASKYDPSTVVTVPNVNQGFWEVAVDDTTVNGNSTGLTGRTAILDTGTTLLYVPSSDSATIHAMIPGAQKTGGEWTIPCNSNAVLAFTIGGRSFSIDRRDLIFGDDTGNGQCISSIGSGSFGSSTEWLVGDTFLKNVYFSANTNEDTITLAKLS